MGKFGQGLSALGFFVCVLSLMLTLWAFMFGGNPVIFGFGLGLGALMLFGGALIAGRFPDQQTRAPVCQTCQAPLPEGAGGCLQCGLIVKDTSGRRTCPECQEQNEMDAVFCKSCGKAVG